MGNYEHDRQIFIIMSTWYICETHTTDVLCVCN